MAPSSVVVTIDKSTNISLVELNESDTSVFFEKQKPATTKQFSWTLLLKAHRILSFFTRLAMGVSQTLISVKKRIALADHERDEVRYKERLIYKFIKLFLVVSIMGLFIEFIAYFQRWDLDFIHEINTANVMGLLHWLYVGWVSFRGEYVAPFIMMLSQFCVVLFMIQSLDRFVLGIGCFWIKLKNIKPRIDGEGYDVEDGCSFPMVLVQIPMCNEREVYQQSIASACQLDWPKDRILIQVLDDSNFQPNPDFLQLTVPHFKGKPDVGLVQARWSFVNKDENLLTRLQNINLCFHFEVEQQVNGHFLSFFGFNGTAGVWRIKALEESGGWLERTTVEDMDIAVRAHLNGWKFVYLNDVKVLCELPESYEAYKKQQHRWHSGPMQLFRLCLPAILKSKISKWKKANLIFLFFLLRKLILPFYSFTLFCVILPLTMFIPEAELPIWVICYVPVTMSILNILPAPKSFPFLMPYLLFENTMSVTKFNAMLSGLFQLGSAYEWVVTKKTGRSSESDLLAFAERESKSFNEDKIQRRLSESGLEMLGKLKEQEAPVEPKKKNRIYRKELALACLLLTAATRSLLSAHGIHFYFLLFQGLSFLVVGLDLIGEQVV
ncbi:hypothetical protein L1987_05468 [Smallanthus sonchifolius]|uniref:Uncharacterized protein n=1 Tax=Smallanthus sonchifolius TaxID=185202 RepID=A0ACB9JVH8_9ASTR|nr:hypothetical protein L1987_05468 [Smallanthus sonchifolius]